ELGLELDGALEADALEVARPAAVSVILMLAGLVPGHLDLVGVDHDDEVTGVHVGGEARLVLAAQDHSDLARQPADGHICRIDNPPSALFLGACGGSADCFHVWVLLCWGWVGGPTDVL